MSQVYGQSGDDPSMPRPGELAREQPDVVEGDVIDSPGAVGGEALEAVARITAWRPRPSSCIGGIALILLCLLVFLPGFSALPPVDRDESRFAQASRQMYESVALHPAFRDPVQHGGGFLVPMVQDRPRLNKPPLIYWLQATSAALFSRGNPHRDAIWMYRIPSLIGGLIAVLVLYRLGTRMFDRRTGWLAAALLAISPIIAWEAHQARADMVLLAITVLAMAALWEVWRGQNADTLPPADDPTAEPPTAPSLRAVLTLWIALGLGILTKGPITPLVLVLAALALSAFSGRWRWLLASKPLLGVLIVTAIVVPWVWAVGERVGWDHYLSTIQSEVFARTATAKEGHWGPPGYHTLLLPVLFWPGSLLTAAGLILAWRAARGRASSTGSRRRLRWNLTSGGGAYAFCLAWILPAWIIFELVATKLPHYTMPLYPAVALLSARAVLAADAAALPEASGRGARIGFWIWATIGVAFVIGAGAGAGLRALGSESIIGTLWRLLIALVLMSIAIQSMRRAYASWHSGKLLRVQLAGIVVAIVAIIGIVGMAMPVVNDLPRALASTIAAVDPHGARPLAAVHYHEDSLIFTTRARAQRISEDELDAWFNANPRGLAIVPKWLQDGRDWPYHAHGYFHGLNIAKGRMEPLMLIERAE